MRTVGHAILAVTIVIGAAGCGDSVQQSGQRQASQPSNTPLAAEKTFEKVRGPAVAGMFYPRQPDELGKSVDELLAGADPAPIERLRGLVCPHAGYRFSGPTAAMGYKLLAGQSGLTVVILAPSHTAQFEGASIPDVDAYETPLGMVPLSPKAATLAALEPFVVNPSCQVKRPDWWRQAPKELPPFGDDTPHSWEHSLEVQLPFLQRALGDFRIVPVVFGQVDPEAVARAVAEQLDDKTIVVASSDLSHYMPYQTAKLLDETCCKAICSLNVEWMERQEACGKGPILALIHLARQMGWKAKLLDCRNSGDTSGDTSRGVVGYAAIAFYEPAGGEGDGSNLREASSGPSREIGPASFSPQQRQFLLELARKTVTEVVTRGKLPKLESDGMAKQFAEPRGCFVTLNKEGRLRGCIGSIFPRQPLAQAIIHAAANAAVRDQRFRPVQREELDQIEIEVSVLTLPERLQFNSPEELLEKLRPHVDGVVLRVGQRESTYLPQVWEQLSDKTQFLDNLAKKAGLSASDWKSPEAKILVYQVEAFEESEM